MTQVTNVGAGERAPGISHETPISPVEELSQMLPNLPDNDPLVFLAEHNLLEFADIEVPNHKDPDSPLTFIRAGRACDFVVPQFAEKYDDALEAARENGHSEEVARVKATEKLIGKIVKTATEVDKGRAEELAALAKKKLSPQNP